jgi:thiol-disulfide isomerase/thioredoxin
MKKLILIITLIGIGFYASGQAEVNFKTYTNFDLAIAESKTTGKPIFVDFYTTWCGPCKVLEREAYHDAAISEVMNKKYISLKYDAEKGEGITLASKYGVTAYPTCYTINEKGEIFDKTIGYPGKEGFLSWLNKAETNHVFERENRAKYPNMTLEEILQHKLVDNRKAKINNENEANALLKANVQSLDSIYIFIIKNIYGNKGLAYNFVKNEYENRRLAAEQDKTLEPEMKVASAAIEAMCKDQIKAAQASKNKQPDSATLIAKFSTDFPFLAKKLKKVK